MKRIVIASILGLSVLSLSACDESSHSEDKHKVETVDFSKSLVKDKKTGCLYVHVENEMYSSGYHPYYDKNGNVAGCGKTE